MQTAVPNGLAMYQTYAHIRIAAGSKEQAKGDNLEVGLGQCAAEMVAAQRFNAEAGNDIPCVYGAITTGINWRFLKLKGQQLYVDMMVYTLERCDKILGILAGMVKQQM